MNSISTAAELVGGVSALARLLGVTPSAVHQWLRGHRPVPAERCPVIERLTNRAVTCEKLRPDVEWGVLRQSAAQESPHG
ncbi:helix-turn-helix domain-containing protein [Comamonas sp. Tr-654]|uniref:transcriptional regulator n=1 Tax=Comamonas sp. Tr-654 TaxID=2608341 RepID=UPI001422B51B|nr:helix-turn-helix domain-containing protein [Comamonas sp. Tr-654]NIF85268.1 helix-turn-helix domain-containing protein [Comamonas sp. Tr-654]